MGMWSGMVRELIQCQQDHILLQVEQNSLKEILNDVVIMSYSWREGCEESSLLPSKAPIIYYFGRTNEITSTTNAKSFIFNIFIYNKRERERETN